MIEFTNMQVAGSLPQFFDETDKRGAVAQAHSNYAHGGGWQDFQGFTLKGAFKEGAAQLNYPDDPPTREISRAKLRDELVIMFEHAWVAVVQLDGTFRVARMD